MTKHEEVTSDDILNLNLDDLQPKQENKTKNIKIAESQSMQEAVGLVEIKHHGTTIDIDHFVSPQQLAETYKTRDGYEIYHYSGDRKHLVKPSTGETKG